LLSVHAPAMACPPAAGARFAPSGDTRLSAATTTAHVMKLEKMRIASIIAVLPGTGVKRL
jgi:hypothetical protein